MFTGRLTPRSLCTHTAPVRALKRTRVVRVKQAVCGRVIMRCKGQHKRKKEEQYSLTYSAPVRLHRALPMDQYFFSVPVKILIQNS